MSDSDDLILDEESLKQIDIEEQLYLSQKEVEIKSNKRKSSECQDDEPVEKMNSVYKKQVKTDWRSKSSRKTLILGIMGSADNSTISSSSVTHIETPNESVEKSGSPGLSPITQKHLRADILVEEEVSKVKRSSYDSSKRSRKQLAVEMMRKNSEEKSMELTVELSPLSPLATDIMRKSNSTCGSGIVPSPLSRKELVIEMMRTKNSSSEHENSDTKRSSEVFKCKKQFDTPLKEIPLISNNNENSNPSTVIATMERKFPGPAGLLPDKLDNFDNHQVSKFINDIEDSHDDSIEKYRIEFYSQDTKKMFSNGAWKNMLNDLPDNFLNGYDISTIKSSINKSGNVPFIGAVISSIDITRENPRVVLKDITDSVNGTIHENVLNKYTLDSGQVILLRDIRAFNRVGKSRLVVNSYVTFDCENILGIYSDKKTIYKHPEFNNIISKATNYYNNCNNNLIYTPEQINHDNSNDQNQSTEQSNQDNNGNDDDDDDCFNIDEISRIEETHLTQKNVESNQVEEINKKKIY